MPQEKENEIWIIDDDRLDVLTVKRAFSHLKFDIPLRVFNSATEALKNIKAGVEQFPDLILLDLNMPGMDGIQFLREIRTLPEYTETPVFILTTSNDPEDKQKCEDLNAIGFYTKPVDFFKLVPAMVDAMDSQEFD